MPATLTVLSLSLAIVLGAFAAGIWSRLHFVRTGTTFRCKVRHPDGGRWDVPPRWPRHKVRAMWVHDVLFIHSGVLRPRTAALSAWTVEHAVRGTTRREVGRLGPDPVVLELRLDDGRLVEVAARDTEISTLVGPFLAAAVSGSTTVTRKETK